MNGVNKKKKNYVNKDARKKNAGFKFPKFTVSMTVKVSVET